MLDYGQEEPVCIRFQNESQTAHGSMWKVQMCCGPHHNIANLNIKLFVINNGGYASIRKSQDAMAGGRYTDDIDVLNFSKIAEAFEIDFMFISKSVNMEQEIASILETKGPCLIELLCDPNQEILEVFKE